VGKILNHQVSATILKFGEEFRPVKLERYCYGYPQSDDENDFRFDNKLNSECDCVEYNRS
jgi:hypothetical protein